jgi:hypothetical protein
MASDPTLDKLLPVTETQFATSINRWESWVITLYNGVGKMSDPTNPEERMRAATAYRESLLGLRQELINAPSNLALVEDVLRAKAAEAKYRGAVLKAWPPAAVAREMLYLGAALFGAGGAAYALLGYPALDGRIVPPVILWTFGLGVVLEGLRRLEAHESRRWRYFESNLRIPP